MKVKLCGWAGCSAITTNKYYCDKHQAIADKRNAERKVFTKRGYSGEYNSLYRTTEWRKLRAKHLSYHPFCVRCGSPAKIVDHINPHHGNMELFLNEDNLQSLCMSCHSAKTLAENNYFHWK